MLVTIGTVSVERSVPFERTDDQTFGVEDVFFVLEQDSSGDASNYWRVGVVTWDRLGVEFAVSTEASNKSRKWAAKRVVELLDGPHFSRNTVWALRLVPVGSPSSLSGVAVGYKPRVKGGA